MELKSTDNINIEKLKIVIENLDGFEEFCKNCTETRSKTFVFTPSEARHSYMFCKSAKFKGITLYQSVCDSFKVLYAVFDGIIKNRNSEVNIRYQYLSGKSKFDLDDYHDYIESQSKFFFEQAYNVFKNNECEGIDGVDLNGTIPFVLEIDALGAFKPRNNKKIVSARLKICLEEHKKLRGLLWLVSLSNATYYYWSYRASCSAGQEKEINDLRAEIYSERTEKYIALSEVSVLKINELLLAYKSESNKGKDNGKSKEFSNNKTYIKQAIDEVKSKTPSLNKMTDEDLFEYFRTRIQLISNKSYVTVQAKTIKKHMKTILKIN